jgi:sec-independent protein translocase protein TatA
MLLAWTIGPLELVVIIAVILLVLGPSKLPALGESVGKMLRSFRKEMKQIEHDKKQEAERNGEIDVTPKEDVKHRPG